MGYDEDLAEELKANTGPKKASQTEMKWLNRLNGMVETALGVIEVRGTTTPTRRLSHRLASWRARNSPLPPALSLSFAVVWY